MRRAAFDVGSATTKVKVADIDICKRRIIKVLLADDAPVFYRDDVLGKTNGSLSDETMDHGIEVLRAFKARALEHKPDGFSAVATSAFRIASNGEDYMERIKRDVGIYARVISQGEEAELGFLGSVAALALDSSQALVWDVGGQSMQMTVEEADGGLHIYQNRFSSGQMRNYIVKDLQHRDGGSPNPISAEIAAEARDYASAMARRDVPPHVKERCNRPSTVIVGIGALKYYADKRSQEATLSGLQAKLDALIGQTDEQIGGDYASTQVSDRLLIVGFMDALGIRKMLLADVDLSDGLLFHADYWE